MWSSTMPAASEAYSLFEFMLSISKSDSNRARIDSMNTIPSSELLMRLKLSLLNPSNSPSLARCDISDVDSSSGWAISRRCLSQSDRRLILKGVAMCHCSRAQVLFLWPIGRHSFDVCEALVIQGWLPSNYWQKVSGHRSSLA